MRARSLLASAALACASMPALADVKVGDKAPEIVAGSWYNLPKQVKRLTSDHLKGQIVMVEFWATW